MGTSRQATNTVTYPAMLCRMVTSLLLCLAAFLIVRTEAQKLPRPPSFARPPVCKNPPCSMKRIGVSIYIEDSLWDKMSNITGGDDPTDKITDQLKNIFKGVNEHLATLDNGGFKVEIGRPVVKLGRSEISLKNNYVDRINGNVTKRFDPDNIFSHTFAFQEAVQKLADRSAVDLRILVIPERGPDPTLATSEETCICNPDWFGCVAIFSIRSLTNWSYHKNIFAHEIGHALGMDLHDDQFYSSNPGDRLLMWSSVGRGAAVWSPEAQRRIRNQDNSCLDTAATTTSPITTDTTKTSITTTTTTTATTTTTVAITTTTAYTSTTTWSTTNTSLSGVVFPSAGVVFPTR